MTIYKILCIQMRGSVLYYIKFSVREQASPAFSPYFFLSYFTAMYLRLNNKKGFPYTISGQNQSAGSRRRHVPEHPDPG